MPANGPQKKWIKNPPVGEEGRTTNNLQVGQENESILLIVDNLADKLPHDFQLLGG